MKNAKKSQNYTLVNCQAPSSKPANESRTFIKLITFIGMFVFVLGSICTFSAAVSPNSSFFPVAVNETENLVDIPCETFSSYDTVNNYDYQPDNFVVENTNFLVERNNILESENETLKSQISYIGNDFLSYVKNFYFPVRVTYYCSCNYCSGLCTASGSIPQAGHTLATDSRIPFGTVIMIDAQNTTSKPCIDGMPIGKREFTVEDRGGAINGAHFDIFVNSHNEALANGTHTVYCKIVSIPENLSETQKQQLIDFLVQASK